MPLDEEKQKLLLEHKLAVRRICIEKGFFLMLIALLGWVANILLEDHRAENVKAQFLHEKRFSAASSIRKVYTTMTSSYYSLSASSCNGNYITNSERRDFKVSVRDAMDSINRSALLFGNDYERRMNAVLNVMRGISVSSEDQLCKYRPFVSDLSDYFVHITKEELGVETSEGHGYQPLLWSKTYLDKFGLKKYLTDNYRRWQDAT